MAMAMGTDTSMVEQMNITFSTTVLQVTLRLARKPGLRTGSAVRTDMSNPASLFVAFILIP